MPAAGEVREIVAAGVCLSFERDVAVGAVPIAILYQSDEPFQHVKEIERDEKEFAHLGGVDAFVVYDMGVDPPGVARPEGAEKVYAKPFRH